MLDFNVIWIDDFQNGCLCNCNSLPSTQYKVNCNTSYKHTYNFNWNNAQILEMIQQDDIISKRVKADYSRFVWVVI